MRKKYLKNGIVTLLVGFLALSNLNLINVKALENESEMSNPIVDETDNNDLYDNQSKTYFLKKDVEDEQSFINSCTQRSNNGVVVSDTGSAIPLSSEIISYNSFYDTCMQIPCEKLGGIYFLNGNILTFYSIETDSVEDTYVISETKPSSVYVRDDKIYYLTGAYNVLVFNLLTKSIEKEIVLDFPASDIGVDDLGRIYLSSNLGDHAIIYLLNPAGELLSQVNVSEVIYGFGGFDSTNGNFYIDSYENWSSWGYEHDMHALRVGNVNNDTMTVDETVLMFVCQSYWYERQAQIDMFESKYLCVDSTFYSGLSIWDSNRLTVENLEDTEVLFLNRNNEEVGSFDNLASVGIRAVYLEDRDSVISFRDNSTIAEYSISTGEELISMKTSYPVFSLLKYGEGVIAIEKSGPNFYYEYFSWKPATEIIITGNSSSVEVSNTLTLSAETNSDLNETLFWKSSDPKVASVNQNGEVFGWNAGEVNIIVTTSSGCSAEYSIRVEKNPNLIYPDKESFIINGEKSYNLSRNDYIANSDKVYSYLISNPDGTYTRVENISEKIIVENYNSNWELLSKKTLNMELPIFGGFYSGEDNNYFVFGQSNTNESDDVEVLRVVKFSKEFEKIDSVSIYGANTVYPFAGGSLRMIECDGKLYVYTCHGMYTASDGYNHQANMTFVINQEDMAVVQSYYDVMNIAQAGYVSHSFNQFIQTDGTHVFRVDHGDMYPRAISITKCNADGDITDVSYALPIPLSHIPGNNDTGVSIGGFELSKKNCIIAGNGIDFTDESVTTSDHRNIFVSFTDQDFKLSFFIWLTNYKKSDNIIVSTPQLVKIGDDQFIVMWEETNQNKVMTKCVSIDSEGNLTSDIVEKNFRLSDCQPISCQDGIIRWYTTENTVPTVYNVSPFDLDGDGNKTPVDLIFSDIDESSWYKDSVQYVYDHGMMSGDAGLFRPEDNMTRAMMVSTLYRLDGSPEVTDFTATSLFGDVYSGAWFETAVNWSYNEGISVGYPDIMQFGVDDSVTREQLAALLYRYAEKNGYDVSAREDLADYIGYSEISEYAKDSMSWAVSIGVISGIREEVDGVVTYDLAPKGYATRAQLASILMRFCEYYEI